MKKLLLIIFPILLAVVVFFSIEYYLNKASGKGALQVTSIPVTDVYLDKKLIGKTPLCRCKPDDMLPVGEYTIRLVPQDANLLAYEEKVSIQASILTVLDRTFGKGAESEGSTIFLSPLDNKTESQILILSLPEKAEVFLDSNHSGQAPLLLKNIPESDHEVKIIKEGYRDKIVRVRTSPGYKLTVVVSLGINPATETVAPIASPSATLQKSVVILATPTGFLRVREEASVSSLEIGRVLPGATYELLEQTSDWFQIKLKDEKKGWISAQYAQVK